MAARIRADWVLLLLFAASPLPAGEGFTPPAFQSWEPGLAVLRGDVLAQGKRVAVTAARISLAQYRVEVAIPRNAQTGDSLTTFQEQSNAAVVLSGGYLSSYYPPIPLGLVRHVQAPINRAAGGDLLTGILLVQARKVAILGFRPGTDVTGSDEALQAGPLLVSGGRSVLSKPAKIVTQSSPAISREYTRAFVALLPNDQLVLAVTGPVSLPALTDWLIRPAAQGGLACLDALNLSGDRTSGLLIRSGNRQLADGNVRSYLANAILAKPAEPMRPSAPARRRR